MRSCLLGWKKCWRPPRRTSNRKRISRQVLSTMKCFSHTSRAFSKRFPEQQLSGILIRERLKGLSFRLAMKRRLRNWLRPVTFPEFEMPPTIQVLLAGIWEERNFETSLSTQCETSFHFKVLYP